MSDWSRRIAFALLLASRTMPLSAQDATGSRDALRLIESLAADPPPLIIDGIGSDWGDVPTISDQEGDAGADTARDIVGVAVLPGRDALVVRVDTRARPSSDDRTFWLNLDVRDSWVADLQVGLSSDGVHYVRVFENEEASPEIRRVRFPWAVDEVVEIYVPYETLEDLLGEGAALRGPEARSWVRAVAITWDRDTGEFTDFASAASYRLVPDLGPLDPPLPRPSGGPAAVLDFPLQGRWMVSQGPFGPGSHAEIWAYDISRADEGLHWSRPRDSCDNEDFWGWNEPVTAPAPGRVVRSAVDRPDEVPCRRDGVGGGNEVYLDVGDDVGIWMAHFRQASVAAAIGDLIEPGRYLGRVGNSGSSTGPHLHMGAYRLSDGQTTLPLSFRNVRVGLNPVPDDPWVRSLGTWEPRGGFFVEGRERD